MLKLYWRPQTRAFRALWLLEEAGIPYERVSVDTNAPDSVPEFATVNPMRKVPAIKDGEAMVAESAAICTYVADQYPKSGLAPAIGDPLRGRYLHWLFFAAACIEPAYTQKFTGLELPPGTAGWGSFERVIDVLEDALKKGPWLLGARFTAADVMIGSDLDFGINRFKIVSGKPAIDAYAKRCVDRPAYKRALAIDAAGV